MELEILGQTPQSHQIFLFRDSPQSEATHRTIEGPLAYQCHQGLLPYLANLHHQLGVPLSVDFHIILLFFSGILCPRLPPIQAHTLSSFSVRDHVSPPTRYIHLPIFARSPYFQNHFCICSDYLAAQNLCLSIECLCRLKLCCCHRIPNAVTLCENMSLLPSLTLHIIIGNLFRR